MDDELFMVKHIVIDPFVIDPFEIYFKVFGRTDRIGTTDSEQIAISRSDIIKARPHF